MIDKKAFILKPLWSRLNDFRQQWFIDNTKVYKKGGLKHQINKIKFWIKWNCLHSFSFYIFEHLLIDLLMPNAFTLTIHYPRSIDISRDKKLIKTDSCQNFEMEKCVIKSHMKLMNCGAFMDMWCFLISLKNQIRHYFNGVYVYI